MLVFSQPFPHPQAGHFPAVPAMGIGCEWSLADGLAHRFAGTPTQARELEPDHSTSGTHTHAHARVHMALACSRAQRRTSIQAWRCTHTLAHAGRKLLVSTRAFLSGSHTQTELAPAFPPTHSLMGALGGAGGIPTPQSFSSSSPWPNLGNLCATLRPQSLSASPSLWSLVGEACPEAFLYSRFALGLGDVVNRGHWLRVRSWHPGTDIAI